MHTYERVQGARVDEAYLSPGTDFSRYSQLYAMPLEIYYAKGEGAPTEEDLQRMRSIFRNAFLNAIANDYPIVNKPAKNALGVRASLVDFKSGPVSGDLPIQGRLRALVANGSLTFLMELSDSASGKVLARAADQEKHANEACVPADCKAGWQQAEESAAYWAQLFRQFLDENLGR
ncbi:MAG: DUF3313 domain-containing protein [Gammaproteobacteria bacterium]|nr:DUF3313 domain-containing protein [Gammaproteobacteria bacterium]MCP4089820.1 DUF3313 domain-containing protein [Gammaproteobacteria bacterium]MCP4275344.1 DUF3313 domain-containing protein [Gammaproteobacteria bacterium]MCP4831235.1 DUF3313 domain-containing protein [Gammaproteobacteria bacterium]MCP4927646.1 DUF3313 domain-containing protein [Gammaproteobacteria bacterium]